MSSLGLFRVLREKKNHENIVYHIKKPYIKQIANLHKHFNFTKLILQLSSAMCKFDLYSNTVIIQ